METHLRVLGWFYLLSGALLLISAVVTGTALAGGGLLAGDFGMFVFLSGLGAFVTVFLLLLGLPGVIEGYGLLRRRRWARPLGFVLAVLNLFNFPLGTLLGGYTLWVLFQPETQRILRD